MVSSEDEFYIAQFNDSMEPSCCMLLLFCMSWLSGDELDNFSSTSFQFFNKAKK